MVKVYLLFSSHLYEIPNTMFWIIYMSCSVKTKSHVKIINNNIFAAAAILEVHKLC